MLRPIVIGFRVTPPAVGFSDCVGDAIVFVRRFTGDLITLRGEEGHLVVNPHWVLLVIPRIVSLLAPPVEPCLRHLFDTSATFQWHRSGASDGVEGDEPVVGFLG